MRRGRRVGADRWAGLHLEYNTHPNFHPRGEGASYTLKNAIFHLIALILDFPSHHAQKPHLLVPEEKHTDHKSHHNQKPTYLAQTFIAMVWLYTEALGQAGSVRSTKRSLWAYPNCRESGWRGKGLDIRSLFKSHSKNNTSFLSSVSFSLFHTINTVPSICRADLILPTLILSAKTTYFYLPKIQDVRISLPSLQFFCYLLLSLMISFCTRCVSHSKYFAQSTQD